MEALYKLKKLLKSLEQIKGRHTELISVYIPQGYKIVDVSNQLKQEQGTAVNIKSKATRKNVLSALEKVIQYLKLYKQTPEHGLAVFCGNVSKKEGISDIKLWAIEPPDPLKVRLYRCDQTFILDPLKEQLKEKELYGLIVIDNSDATIGMLKGKNVQVLRHFESIVPGKQIKGGQSAVRFARVREGLKNDWYKQIAERARDLLPSDIKGIIIGGPGPAKEDFYKGGYLITDLKNKVIGVKSVSDANESGLNELLGRSSDILAETAITREKQICQIFLSLLQKESGLVAYGLLSVLKALEAGAVETLLVSEGLEYTEAELKCGCGIIKRFVNPEQELICQKCGQKQQITKERDAIEAFEELAKQHGSKFEVISRDTVEGNQIFQLGGIVAVLRWMLK